MKISQLIEKLTNAQKDFGDVDVAFRNCNDRGKLSSVDYFTTNENRDVLILAEEWF